MRHLRIDQRLQLTEAGRPAPARPFVWVLGLCGEKLS
jgi:hypothetical protein